MNEFSQKKDIFIISTPFQLISAYEAIYSLNVKSHEIYVLFDCSQVNKLQLKKTINILSIDNIEYFFENNEDKYFYVYEKVRLIIKLLLNKGKIKSIYLGNYTARLYRVIAKFFSKDEVCLLDDGVATLSIQNSFGSNNFHHLFTMFNLRVHNNQKIVTHNFQGLKSLVLQNHIGKNDTILVLGGKLSEVNIVSSEYYYEMLKKIKEKFVDKTILYIPHRGEDKEKLYDIENNIGFIIKEIDYPVELIYIEGIVPATIVSFFSTALLSLQKIYSDVNVYAVRLDYNKIMNRKKAIIDLYSELEKYIDVVDISK